MMSVFEQFENDNQISDDSSQSSSHSQDSEVSDSDSISREWVNSNEPGKNWAEEDVLPQIAGWRRVRREDGEAIKRLQDRTGVLANTLYPKRSIDDLIERCYFSIVQYDSKGDLVSFTALDCYPHMPSTPFWNEWLSTNYKMNEINAGNVLFIHYMVWKPEHEDKFLPLLLETSFAEFLRLKYIIIIKPPKANVPHFYTNSFFPVLPIGLEELENSSIQLLLICLRSSIIRPLRIRIPFDQEYEDILDAFMRMKKQKWKNDLYVRDLFNLIYSKNNKSLMCEFEGQMAGLMILNLKIDLDLLNEGFELDPFGGLRKPVFEGEDFEPKMFSLSENSSLKENRSTNVLMPSRLLFAPMNWDMSFSKLKERDSSTAKSASFISSDSQLSSQFSFMTLSTIVDIATSSDVEQVLSRENSHLRSKLGEVNVLIPTPGSTMGHFYPHTYHGQSNAFLIDFFAIDCSKVDEKQSSFDFLEAAFKIVPDRDYCILITPTDTLPCSLLDLFVRVTPRPLTSLKRELYLCHKNSLSIISMSVRRAEKDDLVGIKRFLNFVDEGDTVYHDILTNCFDENNNFESFILTLEENIVGVSLINSRGDVESFHMYFELSDFACTRLRGVENNSVIKHLVISPMYYNHARFFVRDIMRLVDVSCLYYANITSWKRQCSLVTVLREFTPVKPRRKAGSHKLIPISEEEYSTIPFGLYILSPRLCGVTKIHMNIVIVVVGASRTALSFFENLIFGPASSSYNYNNLICVSPHGLEIDDDEEHFPNLMFPVKDNFSQSYLSMLSLETHVSFIHGVMTGINRSEKYIVVNNKSTIKYDYLILTCGLQYLIPVPAALVVPKSPNHETCRNNFKSSLARFLRRSSGTKSPNKPPRHPNNMFIINTLKDAQNALHALQFLMRKIKKDGKKIIVYGHDLHVFLTINTLLKLGIPGEIIVFVEPFPSSGTTVTLFNDNCVDQAVLDEVKGCKVSYYHEYFLYDWSVSSEDYITSIIFHSKRKRLVIPCLAFFPFLEKLVPDVTFNACNDAGLVYDGRLVINHNFRTNDNYIYAAGTFTKYARRYYASEFNHKYYNSREVGKKLAEIIRGKIDHLKEEETKEKSDLIPKLVSPTLLYCQLPGDFNLFILRKPGRELDLETAYNLRDYGEVLTTGDCKMTKGLGYFRLHLSPEGFVESITCYTKDKIDYVNLSSLYGLHERILNNLLMRYDTSVISDFFEYFRQPWALALYHNHFQRLRNENYKAFFQMVFENSNFYDRIIEQLELSNWKSLDDSVKQRLESDYQNSKVHDDVKSNLLHFLEYHKQDLPVYATFSAVKKFFDKRPRH